MQIYIHTYGRAGRQATIRHFDTLPARFQPRLLVQHRERDLYNSHFTEVLPPGITRLSPTRDWIIQNSPDKVVMMDDDLKFFKRREDEPTKFIDMTNQDMYNMLSDIEECLDDYVHVGVSGREGANRNTSKYKYNDRMMRVLAYDTRTVRGLNLEFSAIPLKQDFHMTLSLLELGYDNCVLNDYVHNQVGGSAMVGGCSHYRTPELMVQAAHILKGLHPKFVDVVEKETKTAWGGGTRTDVRCKWKAARASWGD